VTQQPDKELVLINVLAAKMYVTTGTSQQLALPSVQACADGSRRHLALGTITSRHRQSYHRHRLAVGIELTLFGNRIFF
jgi:hypothetical protein